MPSELVSIVVPCFNEESSLAEQMRRLLASLEAWQRDFELILVNDASRDA